MLNAATLLFPSLSLFSATTLTIVGFTLLTFYVDGNLVQGSGLNTDALLHSHAFGVAMGKISGNGLGLILLLHFCFVGTIMEVLTD